jgi:hypothetical protein
VISGN